MKYTRREWPKKVWMNSVKEESNKKGIHKGAHI